MTIEDRLRRLMLAACLTAIAITSGCSVSDEDVLELSGQASVDAQSDTAADTTAGDAPSDPAPTAGAEGEVAEGSAEPDTALAASIESDASEQSPVATTPALAVIEEKTSNAGSPFARLFSRASVDEADDQGPKPLIDMNGRGRIAGAEPALPDPGAEQADEVERTEPAADGDTAIETADGSVEGISPEADDVAAAIAEETIDAREAARMASTSGALLPGVRDVRALYQIPVREGFDYTSYDDENGVIQLASAAGLAALAGSRLAVQHDKVDVACLKPRLVQQLRQIERHFGRKVLVTSGFRNRSYNRKVGGARESRHMYCEAADIQVPGVSKWKVAEYVRALPGRGGVGTYCHTESIHVDIGRKRDWNWACRRKK